MERSADKEIICPKCNKIGSEGSHIANIYWYSCMNCGSKWHIDKEYPKTKKIDRLGF